MAWFDKTPGGKKGPDAEPAKKHQAPKPVFESSPVTAAIDPKPAAQMVGQPTPFVAPSVVGYLYQGSRVSGLLSFQGPTRIDGIVDGEIQCQGALTIGASAEVKAKITAQRVVVHGKVEGNVSAKEKIELIAPARLIGDMHTPRLIITEGVVFDGDCFMGVAKQKGGVVDSQGVVTELAPVTQSAKS